MKTMTKLFGLGAIAAGGAFTTALVARRRAAKKQQQQIDDFDFADLEEPMVVTEEVVIVSEASPFDVDIEWAADADSGRQTQPQQNQNQQTEPSQFAMPGRGAPPR